MIEADKRKAIFLLHQEGMGLREISRRLNTSPHAVGEIIAQQGEMPRISRKDKIRIDPELLRRLYGECGGWMQRVHERLVEEEGVQVGYATLTRLLRALGISGSPQQRCGRVADEPGAEFQHDTTIYQVKLGEKLVRLVASLLYLRYSKRRYLKFYRAFNRFKMKCLCGEFRPPGVSSTRPDLGHMSQQPYSPHNLDRARAPEERDSRLRESVSLFCPVYSSSSQE